MWTDRVRVLDDVSPAEWLTGELLDASTVIPRSFEAYARVLHPIEFQDRRHPATMRWSDVAALLGRRVHPTTRWHDLIGTPSRYERNSEALPGAYPAWGNLAVTPLRALCDVLASHTDTPDDCLFAVWSGWGWLSGGTARVSLTTDGGVPAEPLMTAAELAAPRLRLPGRNYFLLQGPISAMGELVHYDGPGRWAQSPSLFWPADRAWCVATEIDLDSTFVGGSADTISSVLASPELETLPFKVTNLL